MSKHTQGPWGNESHSMGQVVVVTNANGSTIARMTGPSIKDNEANARRIVACVNACDGLSDEIFERGFTVEGQARASARIKAQRDELLASLEEMLAYCVEHGQDWMCMSQARAVIAKVTGGAA